MNPEPFKPLTPEQNAKAMVKEQVPEIMDMIRKLEDQVNQDSPACRESYILRGIMNAFMSLKYPDDSTEDWLKSAIYFIGQA